MHYGGYAKFVAEYTSYVAGSQRVIIRNTKSRYILSSERAEEMLVGVNEKLLS